MLTQICKIAPENAQLNSKIGPVLAFSENFLSFIIDFNSIEILEYNKKNKKAFRLYGHEKPIKCLKFSKEKSQQSLLCSCSLDSLILWDIDKIQLTKNLNGRVIGRDCFKYEPTNCTFDLSNQIIAVSCADLIYLFDTNCHDIAKNETLQSIQNSTSDSFLNITTLENEPIVLVTSTDGSIHIYKFKSEKFILVNRINLVQIYTDFLKQIQSSAGFDKSSLSVCTGLQVFKVNEQMIITCATSTCLFLIDLYTNDLIYLVDLKNANLPNMKNDENFLMPQMVEFCVSDSKQINAALLFLFHNEISVCKCADVHVNPIEIESLEDNLAYLNKDNNPSDDFLTVHPKKSLNKDSPLNDGVNDKELIKAKLPTSMHEFIKSNSLIKKNQSASDKPLTFNSKIKSSGYTAVIKREKFTPIINKNYKSGSMINLNDLENSKPKQTTSTLDSKIKEFKFEVPSLLKKQLKATDKSSAITMLKFSDDGQYLALASNDNLIQYIPSNNLEKVVQVYNGHNETIKSIDISHDGKLLLSSGDDKTCKLWSLKKPMDLLIDIKSLKLTETTSVNFKKEVNVCSFYYLDKFLLIGCDKSLYLCKYHIDNNKNDIQRYLNNSFCKSVKKFELTFAQTVTTVSAINSFYSYIVICGGTDKSIEVFDMNEAKSCLTIHEAHTRPFHQLLQNQSVYNRLSYDLFLSNAVCDGIKLWDLRSAKCVSRFNSHLNRCLPTKVSFSPDSNYIAAGSEDRSTLVYDLRMNGIVKKYGVFSDNVSSAIFNPTRSQLLCGTQDGKIYCYEQK
ncbi:unnamed protein product [Brachionus calyciflorus]|uniref:Uncharacterized protein n=1 Tax=Brachionus calyciflorus TaxID=104777 RepID=A0A813YHK0_9BILA|nr:unnamed protein product [Brachionus calyciflorus]